jgi:translocation and assembly module TamB
MRIRRLALWSLSILLGVPVLVALVIIAALNTAPGRTLAEHQVAALTGGAVTLRGLAGRFPDRLSLAHLELRDAQGAWLTADAIALDWSPLALLHHQALIHRLDIAALSLARLPASTSPSPASPQPAQPVTLPLRITAEHVAIARATIAAPLLPQTATLSLTAAADLTSLETATASLTAHPLDAPGAYSLTARLAPDRIQASLAIAEPENGLVAGLARLPSLGALTLAAKIDGPRSNLAATLDIAAGPLNAHAHGAIDLDRATIAIDLAATAPAMRPAAAFDQRAIAWRAIDLQAHVSGPFTAPDATGRLQADGIEAAGASLRSLVADLSGNAGQVTLKATAEALRLPAPNEALLAAAPIQIEATARLDDPVRPIRFSLQHPLLTLEGTAQTAPTLTADAVLTLPTLTPLAAIGGLSLAGHSALTLHAVQSPTAMTVTADGPLAITGGQAPMPALIGPNASIGLTATLTGPNVAITRLTLAGAAIHLDAHGAAKPGALDLTAKLAATDLALIAPTLNGSATLDAHASGPPDAIALDATLAGDIGGPGFPRAPLRLVAALHGLPAQPTGRITAEGALAGQPIHLALDATRDADGTLHAAIAAADWRSLHAEGALALAPGAAIPHGAIAFRVPTLDDLRPLIGQPLAGSLTADLVLDPAAIALDLQANGLSLAGNHLARAAIKARVEHPQDTPQITAAITADGIAAAGVSGSARLDVAGPQPALGLRATASLALAGSTTAITAAATLDAPARQLRLQTLQAAAGAETLRLLAPAAISFANGLVIDRLRLGLHQAVLDLAGRLSPTLDATVSLHAPADLAATLAPAYAMDGAITLDAKLTGPPAQPGGAVTLSATGLRLRTGPGRALPPARIAATAQLAAGRATIDARLTAGAATVNLTGQAPLGDGPLALRAAGAFDLAMLDPLVTAEGRRLRGRLTIDAAIAGAAAAPRLSGQALLSNGEVQDFTQGLRLSAVSATIRADGDTFRIDSLTGRAGAGSITASGSIGVLAPGVPVDLVITARNARPLASDQVTADLDADLTVKGGLDAGLTAAGHVLIRRAELRIPDTMPASIAVLNVRRPGDEPSRRPGDKLPAVSLAPPAPVALDLVIDAPQQVFVRGRGLDAEMGGSLTIHGPAAAPRVGGGLKLRRGAISIAGTTLTFSRGIVGFDGAGGGAIDPTLDFAADSTAGGVTATLSIGGYVSKPKITLSSIPSLPQDEVLAYLVFKRSVKDLGPFQIAQIAAGLAELTGVTGSGFNPLEKLRKGLGLDRLSVGNSTPARGAAAGATTSPTVEGGRYIADGVYVGAKQGVTGGQTQATVQIDITKGLKLETDVGAGQAGNQVGVTYQFEY